MDWVAPALFPILWKQAAFYALHPSTVPKGRRAESRRSKRTITKQVERKISNETIHATFLQAETKVGMVQKFATKKFETFAGLRTSKIITPKNGKNGKKYS